ncbi:hypothetical protein SAMN05519103_09609 [Rhizobiales bacterium GAS113]|nr:hypothetical protein SAMN05519103_09609 [Rhizobiales bacterium GAS113]
MKGFSRQSVVGAAILIIAGGLTACVSQQSAIPAATQTTAGSSSVPVDSLVGRWGLASYHEDADRARTETAARAQCRQPYVIGKGPSGGVMMHLADNPKEQEEFVSSNASGRTFIGPSGATAEQADLQILSFDKKVMVARWIDAEISSRYGTMIYVRCGA